MTLRSVEFHLKRLYPQAQCQKVKNEVLNLNLVVYIQSQKLQTKIAVADEFVRNSHYRAYINVSV